MLKRADITSADDILRTPRIDRAEVRLLWHSDFWDGPMSGMLIYRGKECWFEMVAKQLEFDTDWYRRFVVLRLSPEQLAEEKKWHELFRDKVGDHTDYDEAGNRQHGLARPQATWRDFYDTYQERAPQDYAGNVVLGWFEW